MSHSLNSSKGGYIGDYIIQGLLQGLSRRILGVSTIAPLSLRPPLHHARSEHGSDLGF